ncbi:hypothetical protein [Paenibacillus sp. NPDC055715]
MVEASSEHENDMLFMREGYLSPPVQHFIINQEECTRIHIASGQSKNRRRVHSAFEIEERLRKLEAAGKPAFGTVEKAKIFLMTLTKALLR